MVTSIPRITLPKGGFHRRILNGHPVIEPDKSWPENSDSSYRRTPGSFGEKLAYFVKTRDRYLFYPSDHPSVAKGLEVARSSEAYYNRYLRALEIFEENRGYTDTTVGAMLFLELPEKEYAFYSSYFSDTDPNHFPVVGAKRAALRKAMSLPFSKIRMSSPAATVEYQALLRRILVGEHFNRELFRGYLSLELARLEDQPHSIMDDAYRRQVLIALAPMAERAELLQIAERLRSETVRRTLAPEEIGRIEDQRIGRFRHITNVENHLDNLKQMLAEAFEHLRVFNFALTSRVKEVYSIWEKNQAKGGVAEDILGIQIQVERLEEVQRVVEFLKSNFQVPDAKRFPRLCRLQDEGKVRFEKDDITKPRESGYSAYTLLLVDQMGEVIEFKVTTRALNRKNVAGEAAHWAYKAERSLQVLGIPHQQDFRAPEPKQEETLLLISDQADGEGLDELSFRRVPAGGQVRDLAGSLGSRPRYYRPRGDRLLTSDGPERAIFRPGRIRQDALVEDGMIFRLPD